MKGKSSIGYLSETPSSEIVMNKCSLKKNKKNPIIANNYVLVVEDDEDLNSLICEKLKQQKIAVHGVFNGKECIDAIHKKTPILMLIDYHLNDMIVEEVLQTLKSQEFTIPFIITTGSQDHSLVVKMMKKGARDYVIKDESFINIIPQIVKRIIFELKSEKKLIEAQIKLFESEKCLSLLADNTKDLISLVDKKGQVTWANKAWKKRFGSDLKVIPDPFLRIHEDDQKKIGISWQKMLAGQGDFDNLTYRSKNLDGHYTWYETSAYTVVIENQPLYYVIARDVSKRMEERQRREKLEKQLHHVQKMETIGQLAGGIAYDFNNILTGIGGYANLLIESIRDESIKKYAHKIYNLVMKGGEINSKLLMYARKNQLEIELLNVHTIINNIYDIMTHTFDQRISISKELNAKPNCVYADHSQLESALLNIALNARDAIPEEGDITLGTEMVSLSDKNGIGEKFNSEPGKYVKITIRDNGIGIQPKMMDKIFDPFYSTKKNNKSSGLGLASVYGCVSQLNGFITVESEPGKGTAFMVFLPLAKGTDDHADSSNTSEKIPANGNILLVDDDNVFRKAITLSLTKMGYTVSSCQDGVEALDFFAKNHENIDLVILDLIMPRMDGSECFYKLREIKHEIPILISSGYAPDQIIQEIVLHKSVELIRKPFSPKVLTNTIARIFKKYDK